MEDKIQRKTYYTGKAINLNPLKATNYVLKKVSQLPTDYTYRQVSYLLSKGNIRFYRQKSYLILDKKIRQIIRDKRDYPNASYLK